MTEDEAEIAYYRAVEDFFAATRGVPHTLSPKDVQLLRSWWRENVPLPAITHAITEVFARRRQHGDTDPTVSLTYCRHAVRRQAQRLSEMRVGEGAAARDSVQSLTDSRSALRRLTRVLEDVADAAAATYARAAELIRKTAQSLNTVPDLDPAALEEHLYNTEATLLDACMQVLPAASRERIEANAEKVATASGASGDAWHRAYRAVVDRDVRSLLGLPHLELD